MAGGIVASPGNAGEIRPRSRRKTWKARRVLGLGCARTHTEAAFGGRGLAQTCVQLGGRESATASLGNTQFGRSRERKRKFGPKTIPAPTGQFGAGVRGLFGPSLASLSLQQLPRAIPLSLRALSRSLSNLVPRGTRLEKSSGEDHFGKPIGKGNTKILEVSPLSRRCQRNIAKVEKTRSMRSRSTGFPQIAASFETIPCKVDTNTPKPGK